ncbi:MAG TPA: transposase [Candidatus Paceibacterota bacterium]|nr:transposase [Candidatus Paceibacterota bacterium]
MLRDKNLVSNEYYHIYNRGNGKSKIFLREEDYDRFLKILYICNSEKTFNFRDSVVNIKIDAFDFERGEPLVSVLAWVLMPNHFHIVLISPRSDLGEEYNPITEFMRKLSTAYVMYFNKKYKRTGGLFEGTFKSRHVGNENYFRYIFSYVHLNPIKLFQFDWKKKGTADANKAIEFLKKYKYSSFQDYFGLERKQGKIISKNSLPEYFSYDHVNDLFQWIKESPLGQT